MWMNFFRCFLTYHLARAHTEFCALFWEWWNKKWEKKSLTCNIMCVCVSRRLWNTPTTDLIKVCVSSLLGIYCHSVRWLTAVKLLWCQCVQVIDSFRPAVVRVERLKQHVRSEAESAAWRFFHDEEHGLDRAHRFIKSRLMSLQRHFTENINLFHHLEQKAPRYVSSSVSCLWRRRIHNIFMIYRAVSSHVYMLFQISSLLSALFCRKISSPSLLLLSFLLSTAKKIIIF